MSNTNETLSVVEAKRLIVEGFVIRFCVFVAVCDEDCYTLDVTGEVAQRLIEHAARLGDTVVAFFNETTGTLCIG